MWAETKGFHYFETSAQTGKNVEDMFELLVQKVVGVTTGGKSGRTASELGYTSEQAALVLRIRSCQDNYQILGLTRDCSR